MSRRQWKAPSCFVKVRSLFTADGRQVIAQGRCQCLNCRQVFVPFAHFRLITGVLKVRVGEGGLHEAYWYVSKSRYPTVLWSKVWMSGMVGKCHSFSVPVRDSVLLMELCIKTVPWKAQRSTLLKHTTTFVYVFEVNIYEQKRKSFQNIAKSIFLTIFDLFSKII